MRKIRSLALVAALASLAVAFSAGPAAAAVVESQPRPIHAYSSGKCVDLRTQDDVTIQLYSCHGGSNQQWISWFYEPGHDPANPTRHAFVFKSKANGKCIVAMDGDGVGGGTDLVRAVSGLACAQTGAMWEVIHEFYAGRTYSVLRSLRTGRCLELRNNSSANNTIIRQVPCVITSPAQAWAIGPTPR
ncbi:RICIN domain-containing protein [Catellatospora aurea]|uniref:RICIN domain-containing protein n=1 Tax=Catellatospora aurea TaxID=1337874 RepID=A0ABW2H836_9ACTN